MSIESIGAQVNVVKPKISFEEKCATFESMTGIRVDETNEGFNKDVALDMLNYHWIFFHAPTEKGQDKAVESLAKAYSEIYENISERFAEDEDEMFAQMGKLNEVFDWALRNSYSLMGGFSPKINVELRESNTEEERIRNELEIAELSHQTNLYNRKVDEVISNFRTNMARHMDNFFETFISKIRKLPFEEAYAESIAQNDETRSLSQISYKDMVNISALLANEPTNFDDDGFPHSHRYRTAEDAFRQLAYRSDIPFVVRQDLAERFGFKGVHE